MSQDNVSFEWIGGNVECNNPGLNHIDNFTFFNSFILNGQRYSINDFAVAIVNKRQHVCKLLTLFQSNTIWHKQHKYQGAVRLFTFLHNLDDILLQDIDTDDYNEVVEDRTTPGFISLDEIIRKCKVVFHPGTVIPVNQLDKITHFYCRFTLKDNRLLPIVDENLTASSVHIMVKNTSPNIEFTPQNKENIYASFPVEKMSSATNLNKLTPIRAKRNLNESFDNTPNSQCDSHCLNYSIVDQEENSLKIKLKLSEYQPKVALVKLDDKILNKACKRRVSFLGDLDIHNQKDIVHAETIKEVCSPKKITSVRCSSRAVDRISYEDWTSPKKKRAESEISEILTPHKLFRNDKKNKIVEAENNKATRLRARSKSTYEGSTELNTRIGSKEETPIKTPRRSTRSIYYNELNEANRCMINLCIASNNTVLPNSRPRRQSVKPKRYDFYVCSPKKSKSSQSKGSDDECVPETPKTPKRTVKDSKDPMTPKNIPLNEQLVMKSGGRIKLLRDGVITPSVQCRETDILKDNTPLKKARTKLHVSHVPKALPCREKEFDDILGFIEGKLLDGCGGCMYVSGVPGTGKTATVTEVINKLHNMVKNKDVPKFEYVSINGMRLTEPRQSYVEILKQLSGKTVPWEQAQTMLENKFTKKSSVKKALPIVLLVDELDILCTKRQDVVYNLLDWPTKARAQLIVITIANTMDLPERLLMGRVTSRLGLTRLTFQAYTHKQLQEIVTKRLTGTNTFNPDAIQLVARKVASVSGDARRALDICRRAAEIAELEGVNVLVSMRHVNEALDAMITQPKVRAIRQCSRLEQLLLEAIGQEVQRTGVEETTFSDVLTMLPTITGIDGFTMVSFTLALAAVSRLGACRLLLTDHKSNDLHQKLILNVSPDDIHYALQQQCS